MLNMRAEAKILLGVQLLVAGIILIGTISMFVAPIRRFFHTRIELVVTLNK